MKTPRVKIVVTGLVLVLLLGIFLMLKGIINIDIPIDLGNTTDTQPPLPIYAPVAPVAPVAPLMVDVPSLPPTRPADYMVRITNRHADGRRTWHGILIRDHNRVIVVTSRLVFTDGFDGTTLSFNRQTHQTRFLVQDEKMGLVALHVYTNDAVALPAISLSDDPNLPPDVSALVSTPQKDFVVVVQGYMTARELPTPTAVDWMLLGGDLPDTCVGAPVTHNNDVVGVVIGLNSLNRKHAIAASLCTLRKFVGFATSIDRVSEVK